MVHRNVVEDGPWGPGRGDAAGRQRVTPRPILCMMCHIH
jgi:hypothetical protein